jgi:ketohexokinase
MGDNDSHIIINDLQQHQIDVQFVQFIAQGKVPTSYISLSRLSGSRTICHYRDLPEFTFEAFKRIPLEGFNWFHFEGRNIKHTLKMILLCSKKSPDTPISLEIEKNRAGIESLIPYARLILFSRHYAESLGYTDARSFCRDKNREYPDQLIFCAWGKSGAGAAFKQTFYWQDAFNVQAINTVGAGDVFNAAIIHQQIQHKSIPDSLFYGCRLAADKCAIKGLIP